YTDTVRDRFPLLYFFLSVLTVFVMYQYQKSVIAELEQTSRLSSEIEKQTRFANERADKLERMSDEMAEALAKTIDAKDTYTNGHSIRVSRYSCALARKLGWSAEEVNDLEREAMLHDIGKIGVPEEILRKPGNLSEEEFEVVKSHTTTGGDILTGIEDMEGSAAVARHHHERFDGTGYPSGLSGDAIPLHARIVTIADAYDAMRSDRVYRGGLSRENIRRELVAGSGNQFDPDLLDAFLELFDSGELDEADDI
ncbi:MAG: HD-GYP domain-containing protein, partial [Clostridia bacterium]|nr:HD-GYP domain-containing protein [Clostridia bacterium]